MSQEGDLLIIDYVSPHITREQWQSGKKSNVDVFEDQLRSFLFKQARAIARNRNSGPAILALISPYFESVTCYLKGKSSRNHATEFLCQGLRTVFPSVDAAARKKYIKEVRHGFAHEAMFRDVRLHRSVKAFPSFGMLNGVLHIDPWWILDQAEAYFDSYIAKVRSRDKSVIAGFTNFMLVRMGAEISTSKP